MMLKVSLEFYIQGATPSCRRPPRTRRSRRLVGFWAPLGGLLGPPGGLWRPSWGALGVSWARPEASWGLLGGSDGPPGGLLGASWGLLGAPWGVLGSPGRARGGPGPSKSTFFRESVVKYVFLLENMRFGHVKYMFLAFLDCQKHVFYESKIKISL